jgi:rod shape-determining protein MreB and related proteins
MIAENPLDCVAIGTGASLEHLDKLNPKNHSGYLESFRKRFY